jgi:hypothetical protein
LIFGKVSIWRNWDWSLWWIHRIRVCGIVRRLIDLRFVVVVASIHGVCDMCMIWMRWLSRVSGMVTMGGASVAS